MTKVAIRGCGITAFGELWNKSLRELAVEASIKALEDASVDVSDIEAIFIANMLSSKTANQSHLGSMLSSELGTNIDSTRIEAACASGGLAVMRATDSILAGRYKNVLVVGVEKMTDMELSEISSSLMEAGDEEWEMPTGATFAGLYALMARAYMEKYGLEEEDLALVSLKNHYHASLNPLAHFQEIITKEDVLESAPVATPLKLLDCSPISDGAAAIVLSDASQIKSKKENVYILGSGAATDTLSLAQRESITSLKATQLACRKAYKEAGVTPKDINIAEVHDCFSIAELLAMEDLGFSDKGKAIYALRKKRYLYFRKSADKHFRRT